MMWTESDITANGIQLHYYRTGGNKPPVVMSHGFSDNGLCWTPIVQALESDYDVIMYDARGHGQSDGPETGYSDLHHADDLAGLITALDLQRPVIIGHSMGAQTAALTAGKYPQLVRGIVLEDPPWRADWADEADVERYIRELETQESPPENHFEKWILDLQKTSREALLAKQRAEAPDWPEGEFEPWVDSKHQFNLAVFSALKQKDMPVPQTWKKTVSAIQCPALLVTGDVDKGAIVTEQLVDEAMQLNPNLRVAHIEGASHNIRREYHEQYVMRVRDFLQEVFA
ncbi:MAG: alpha/beta hydrolase [Anaerolineae bacterium]|nr:alpha/beta hydrolase [Anaerolineae bacterium]